MAQEYIGNNKLFLNSKKLFIMPESDLCEANTNIIKNITIEFITKQGLIQTKTFENVVIPCQTHTPNPDNLANLATKFKLNIKDAYSNSDVSGKINVDCNNGLYTYEILSQESIYLDKNIYSCVISKTSYELYDTNTVILNANGNKEQTIYLNPQNPGNIEGITECRLLNVAKTYYLKNDISSEGTCLNITQNNVKINGNGFTITGDVSSSIAGDLQKLFH